MRKLFLIVALACQVIVGQTFLSVRTSHASPSGQQQETGRNACPTSLALSDLAQQATPTPTPSAYSGATSKTPVEPQEADALER